MPFTKPATEPRANVEPVTMEAHGKTWMDNYAWLRAKNWQKVMDEPSALPVEIADYLKAENNYYREASCALDPLKDQLVAEMRARIKEKDSSIPFPYGSYLYSERYLEDAEHEVYIRTDLNGNNEEVLLDANVEAKKYPYFEIGELDTSPDHRQFFWTCDTSGSENYELSIRTIKTGQNAPYSIDKVDSAAWADANTLFYTRIDDQHRPLQVYKHTLNTDPSFDTLVYEEKDTRFGVGVHSSLSGQFIFIETSTDDEREVWFIPCEAPDTKPEVIQARTPNLEYFVCHQNDRFIILTNANKAADFKLTQTPISTPSMEHWQDLLPYRSGCLIEDFLVLKDWIVWVELTNALPQIAFMNARGEIKPIEFGEEAYSVDIYTGYEYHCQAFVFDYSSPTTPTQSFQFELETEQRVLVKTQEVPSGHNPSDYVTRRLHVNSHDGAVVPVTLLHHKDTPVDGSAPALLYGYGSYGASTYAEFSSNRLSLVNRGFVYILAHVRGGEECGRDWYTGAKLQKKPNSFHDFIAVGSAMIEQGYCAKNQLVSMGGSAGGLLVAASMNMQPDLFCGVIADVPFVDVLHTMLDDSLPMTPSEWSQWGNPIVSSDAFDWIHSYCPYTNVSDKAYPALFVTAGVSDPRVTYWEPAKWVAKLRKLKTNDNLILFNTNMQSGHFGKTGRFAELEDTARSYVFALAVTDRA